MQIVWGLLLTDFMFFKKDITIKVKSLWFHGIKPTFCWGPWGATLSATNLRYVWAAYAESLSSSLSAFISILTAVQNIWQNIMSNILCLTYTHSDILILIAVWEVQPWRACNTNVCVHMQSVDLMTGRTFSHFTWTTGETKLQVSSRLQSTTRPWVSK